jgi:outer membrane immunogenic protein
MRARLIGAAVVFAFAAIQPARGADMAPPYFKAPPATPGFNWTGFYIGGNVGGGGATQSFSGTQTTPFGPTAFSGNDGLGGAVAGGQVGFNYEFASRIVIGIEADADWSNYTTQSAACSTFTGGAFTGLTAGCAQNTINLNDFGTVRGRLGYAWNNVLFFGTGGWAWSKFSGNSALTCLGTACPAGSAAFTGGTASFSNSPTGWTAGGGVEWAFLPNWTARLEYLFVDFPNVSTTYTTIAAIPPGPAGASTTHITSSTGANVLRLGVNYLFTFGGPPY